MAGFVSGDLHKIGKKIAEATSPEANAQEDNTPEIAADFKEESSADTATGMTREYKKALFKRREEFIKFRRDVISRISTENAVIPERLRACEALFDELQVAKNKFDDLLKDLEAIDESQWPKEDFSAEMTPAFKKLENARLEFLRISAKLTAVSEEEKSSAPEGSSSIIHELTSLSFGQLFKFGAGFFLPLIITLIISAVIIAVAYFASLK